MLIRREPALSFFHQLNHFGTYLSYLSWFPSSFKREYEKHKQKLTCSQVYWFHVSFSFFYILTPASSHREADYLAYLKVQGVNTGIQRRNSRCRKTVFLRQFGKCVACLNDISVSGGAGNNVFTYRDIDRFSSLKIFRVYTPIHGGNCFNRCIEPVG